MTKLALFNVWVADDEIAGTVQGNLELEYGPTNHNLRFRCFGEAIAASAAADQASAADDLPDVAVIDLNFNENADEVLIRGEHINDKELKEIIATTKNQLGFLVAAEIYAASARTGKNVPDIHLYTAKPDIKKMIGWAAMPAKFSGQSLLQVEFKHQVEAAEIVRIIEERLWKVAGRRLREEVIDLDVLQACFDLREVVSAGIRRLMLARADVFESASRLAKAIVKSKYMPASPFPVTQLRIADQPESVAQALVLSGQTDYEAAGVFSQYNEVKTSLERLQKTSTPDSESVALFCKNLNESVRSRMSLYFPAVGKQINPKEDEQDKKRRKLDLDQLLKDLDRAIELAALGDYHWSLCRTLKSIKKDGDLFQVTEIAKACHGSWDVNFESKKERFSEAKLQAELDTLPLPKAVKQHLRSGVPEYEYLNLGHLQQMCYAFWDNDRHEWEEPWSKLKELQTDDFEVSIAPELLDRRHLTDWKLFFFGPEAFISQVRSQIPNVVKIKKIILDVSPANDAEQVVINLKLMLDKPLLGAPTGGLKQAMNTLTFWGSSRWIATLGKGEDYSVSADSIWPAKQSITIPRDHDISTGEYYFSILWTINDYLLKRS